MAKKAKKRYMDAMNKKAKASQSFLGGMDSFIADVEANKAGKDMMKAAEQRRKKRKKKK